MEWIELLGMLYRGRVDKAIGVVIELDRKEKVEYLYIQFVCNVTFCDCPGDSRSCVNKKSTKVTPTKYT